MLSLSRVGDGSSRCSRGGSIMSFSWFGLGFVLVETEQWTGVRSIGEWHIV